MNANDLTPEELKLIRAEREKVALGVLSQHEQEMIAATRSRGGEPQWTMDHLNTENYSKLTKDERASLRAHIRKVLDPVNSAASVPVQQQQAGWDWPGR